MLFEMERTKSAVNPTNEQIRKALEKLMLTGENRYASLQNDSGDYVQVAGGRSACMIEYHTADPLDHFRAYHDNERPVFPDGTKLCFAGNEIPLKSDEWFHIDQVIELFIAFNEGRPFPAWLRWRTISDLLQDNDLEGGSE